MKESLGPALLYRLRMARRHLRAWLDRPRWMRMPPDLSGTHVCLFACYSDDGTLSRHALDLSRAWHAQGFRVVLIVASDRPPRRIDDRADNAHLAGILVRKNLGYDFGSWSAAIRSLPSVRAARLLALANDSVYGPLSGFAETLARVERSDAAIVGLTDSHQYVHHIQSYLVFYKPRALLSDAFGRFWHRLRAGGRQEIIGQCELPLMATMQAAGLDVEVLFPTPADPVANPTLSQWRALINAGFPFVKVQLLRDNPFGADLAGWDDVLRTNGYDPANVVEHLGERFTQSAAARTALQRPPAWRTPR